MKIYPAVYTKHEGQQCTGSATDILRDFVGTAEECAFECYSRADCVGFIRVNSGSSSFNGKCYFRGGTLNDPFVYTGDNRDCYEPTVDCCINRCRKEWSTLTQTERDLYINGFKTLADQGVIQQLSQTHFVSADHGNHYFLPWHRAFVMVLEDEIRALGGNYACFGMPFWYVLSS